MCATEMRPECGHGIWLDFPFVISKFPYAMLKMMDSMGIGISRLLSHPLKKYFKSGTSSESVPGPIGEPESSLGTTTTEDLSSNPMTFEEIPKEPSKMVGQLVMGKATEEYV
ncbi:hypothetical protein R6Q59_015110 [Mikania micrantha]